MKQFNILVFLFCTSIIHAMDFHVSVDGNDSNDGSEAAPWLTIQYALEYATSGSTVYIHRGIYNESLYLEVSGAEGEYITFKNFEEDEFIIDGTNLDSYALLEIIDKRYVGFEGLNFMNFQKADAVGILIECASDHIRIMNCSFSEINFSSDPGAEVNENTNAQPLIVYGTEADHAIEGLEIIGNEIFNCRTGYSEALAVNGNVVGFLIEGNSVHDISNIGIDIIGHEETCSDPSKDQARNGVIRNNITYNCNSPYATSAGIYVDGGKNLTIEANRVYNNQWGIEIGCENVGKSTESIVVRNNFIYGNTSAGIAVGGYEYPNGSGKVRNVQIVNNTLYNNDLQDDGTGEFYISYNENLRIVNNNVSATNTLSIMLSTEDESAPGIDIEVSNNNWFDNNIEGFGFYYYNGIEYVNLIELENEIPAFSNNLSRNPLFKAEGDTPDLHLRVDSPLLDVGKTGDGLNYGLSDIDGDDRILGAGLDLGADEYNANPTSLSETKFNKEVIIYPNPSSDFINIDTKNLNYQVDQVHLHNIVGKHLKTSTATEKIGISEFPNGVYLVKLYSGKKLRNVFKVMKK